MRFKTETTMLSHPKIIFPPPICDVTDRENSLAPNELTSPFRGEGEVINIQGPRVPFPVVHTHAAPQAASDATRRGGDCL